MVFVSAQIEQVVDNGIVYIPNVHMINGLWDLLYPYVQSSTGLWDHLYPYVHPGADLWWQKKRVNRHPLSAPWGAHILIYSQ